MGGKSPGVENLRVTGKLFEALCLLNENKPEDPLLFLAAHFLSAAYGPCSLLDAQRYIQLAPPEASTYDDNMTRAFLCMLEEHGDADAVPLAIFKQLLKRLQEDVPCQWLALFLEVVDNVCQDRIALPVFAAAAQASMALDTLARVLQYEEEYQPIEQICGAQQAVEDLSLKMKDFLETTRTRCNRIYANEEDARIEDISHLQGWNAYAAGCQPLSDHKVFLRDFMAAVTADIRLQVSATAESGN